MKRFLSMLAIVALVGGCACPRADVNGVITKSATNCLLVAQDIICDATPEVLAGANVVLNLLKPIAASYIPGTSEYVTYVTAENIVAFGCSTLAGLNGLIAYLESSQARSAMMKKSGAMAAINLPVQPFIDWRNGE